MTEQNILQRTYQEAIKEAERLKKEKEELIKWLEDEIFNQNKSIELLSNKKYADIHIGAISAYKNILSIIDKESDKNEC